MKVKVTHLNRFWIFSVAGLLLALLLLFVGACDNGADGDPIGPSNIGNLSQVDVTPAAITLTKNQTLTFSATGGTEPFSWSVDNSTLGSIDSATGVFTAGNNAGSIKVTATDSNGSTGTATVTISNKTLTVIPTTAQVGKTETQEFTVTGQTDPVFWSITNTALGSIDVTTGIFTAGVTLGTTTVTVLDADGDTATSSVTVISNTIIVTPVSVGPFTAAGTQAFTATTNGEAGTYTWTISGQTGDYDGAAVTVAATATVGTTLTFAQPSSDEGNQTLTVTATDGNGDTGTATVSLTAATT